MCRARRPVNSVDRLVDRPHSGGRQPSVAFRDGTAVGDVDDRDLGARQIRACEGIPVDPRTLVGALIAVRRAASMVEQLGQDAEGQWVVDPMKVYSPGCHSSTSGPGL